MALSTFLSLCLESLGAHRQASELTLMSVLANVSGLKMLKFDNI